MPRASRGIKPVSLSMEGYEVVEKLAMPSGTTAVSWFRTTGSENASVL